MNKVLILGHKGTLGQTLMVEFDLANYEVVGWDREEADITNPEIKDKISLLRPDIIINATGYNAVDKCEIDLVEKELAFKINAEAPKVLAEVAKEIGAVFVNYSTDFVFPGEKREGYKEDDEPHPLSVYGESKFLGEQNIQMTGGKYYIIRLSALFDRAGKSAQSKKTFVDIMLSKKDDPEVKVVDEETTSPTYAPDLARFTRYILENNLSFGIYHGNNSGVCTWYEWACEIFSLANIKPKSLIPVPRTDFPVPAKRPAYSHLVNTKLPPQRSWQEALIEYLKR